MIQSELRYNKNWRVVGLLSRCYLSSWHTVNSWLSKLQCKQQANTQLCHSLTHMMDYTVLWIWLTKKVSQRWPLWINKMKQYFFSLVVGWLHRATLHPIIVIALPLTHSISKSLIKSHQHTETWLWNAFHVVHEMLMQTQNIVIYLNNWALIPKE